jgi:cytochrome c oxidase subunit IV
MAEKGKKAKGSGSGSGAKKSVADKAPAEKVEKAPVEKAAIEKAPVEKAPVEKAVEAKAVARDAHDDHDHDHGAHGDAVAHGGHKVDRREYWIIFGVLFALTVLEVAVAQIPGINHSLMVLALVSLAVTKAACVGLFYMHLKHETKIMKMTVFLPFTAPAVYALVLIGDAAWRLARW